jgi:type III pantothenate kinase
LKVDAVVDVGNTSIKIARCHANGLGPTLRLPHDADHWNELSHLSAEIDIIAIAGVVPRVVASMAEWARMRHWTPRVIADYRQIPVAVNTSDPSSVGVDRLLDALAAQRRFPGQNLIVIDAGTAITINVVSRAGAFEGGAILPGLGLMAKSLNEFTALLPNVVVDGGLVFPGKDTESNIKTGILASAIGAVDRCLRQYPTDAVIITGSDGPVLHAHLGAAPAHLIPTLTLEGIRAAAESLP